MFLKSIKVILAILIHTTMVYYKFDWSRTCCQSVSVQDVDTPKMDEPSALQALAFCHEWPKITDQASRISPSTVHLEVLRYLEVLLCRVSRRHTVHLWNSLNMPGVRAVCWWETAMLGRQMNTLNQRSWLIHPKRRLEEVGRCWEWLACCYHSLIILIFLSLRPFGFPSQNLTHKLASTNHLQMVTCGHVVGFVVSLSWQAFDLVGDVFRARMPTRNVRTEHHHASPLLMLCRTEITVDYCRQVCNHWSVLTFACQSHGATSHEASFTSLLVWIM